MRLGIDIGTSSLGTAFITDDKIIHLGTRIFSAGTEGDIAGGRDESPNVQRRLARQQRRQIARRARRVTKLFNALVRAGLMPGTLGLSSEARQGLLTAVDRRLRNPYQLRAAALDSKLTAVEFGRALYHLAQRRGFLSNSKAVSKDDGVVKGGISDLAKAIEAAQCRTLGEYYSQLDLQQAIRRRYTSRKMYEHEFELIWSKQSVYHAVLTEDLKKKIHKIIFFQRPLKSQTHMIGNCSIDAKEKRCPIFLRLAQRYRLLEQVNNLKLEGESLSQAQRTKLIDALELDGDQTFAAIKKLLGLKRFAKFNLEEVDNKIIGNRTNAAMREALGDLWLNLDGPAKDSLVLYSWGFVKQDKLAQAASKKFGWPAEAAEKFAQVGFEPGYLSISRKAVIEALPKLESGYHLFEVRSDLSLQTDRRIFGRLPSVAVAENFFGRITSATVRKSLTELRKVVNATIERYGLPEEMRVELARDLRKSPRARQDIRKSQLSNKTQREQIVAAIQKQTGEPHPSNDKIERVALANECNWRCPYTGQQISMQTLLGEDSIFQIEHIIPFSRSLDNSFANKTLCCTRMNSSKGNRTPFEAFGTNAKILDEVKKFRGSFAEEKLRRFMMDETAVNEWLNTFAPRALSDTSTAAKYAVRYLQLLYENPAAVRTTNGRVTAFVRSNLHLVGILGQQGSGKNRDDHRHHAVDALAIALTDDAMIAKLSRAAEAADGMRRRHFAPLDEPWDNFVKDTTQAVNQIVVSHRPNNRVRGCIHNQTTYSKPTTAGEYYVRIPLNTMSKAQAESIVDESIRKIVEDKLQDGDPKKVFKLDSDLPKLNGTTIRSARVAQSLGNSAVQIGSGARARVSQSSENHHVEIFASAKGLVSFVVSRREAIRRVQAHELVVNKKFDGCGFVLSLAKGDTVRFKGQMYVVTSLSYEPTRNRIAWRKIEDAKGEAARFVDIKGLTGIEKVFVNPIGDTQVSKKEEEAAACTAS